MSGWRRPSTPPRYSWHLGCVFLESDRNVVADRRALRDAAQPTLTGLGWLLLCERFDPEGSGKVSIGDFCLAVREEAGIPAETATDGELQQLFRAAGAQLPPTPGRSPQSS